MKDLITTLLMLVVLAVGLKAQSFYAGVLQVNDSTYVTSFDNQEDEATPINKQQAYQLTLANWKRSLDLQKGTYLRSFGPQYKQMLRQQRKYNSFFKSDPELLSFEDIHSGADTLFSVRENPNECKSQLWVPGDTSTYKFDVFVTPNSTLVARSCQSEVTNYRVSFPLPGVIELGTNGKPLPTMDTKLRLRFYEQINANVRLYMWEQADGRRVRFRLVGAPASD